MTDFLHSISISSLSSLTVTLQPLKSRRKPSTLTASSTSSFKTLTLTCTSKPVNDRHKPTPKNRKKSSCGTSRRSILKKTFNQEQGAFSFPVSDDPHVGIIGGGMAGLVCALYLEKRGVKSTVFDTVGEPWFGRKNGN